MRSGEIDDNPYRAPEALDAPVRPGPGEGPVGADGIYRVTYRNTGEDIASLMSLGQDRSKLLQALRVLTPLGIVALGVFYAYQIPLIRLRGVLIGLSILWGGGTWWLMRRSRTRSIRKFADQFHERPVQTLEMGPSGFRIRTVNGEENRRRWTSIGEVKVVEAGLALSLRVAKTGNVVAYIVPRRAFGTPEGFAAFAEAAAQWQRDALPEDGIEPSSLPVEPVHEEAATPEAEDEECREVTIELTEAERRQVRLANRVKYRHFRGSMLRSTLISGAIVAATVVWLVLKLRSPRWRWMDLMTPLFLLGINLVALVPMLLAWRPILFGEAEDRITSLKERVVISPKGLANRLEGRTTSFIPWSNIIGIDEQAGFLRFLARPMIRGQKIGGIALVPRRAFATPEEADEFLRAARQWLAEAGTSPV